MNDEAGTAAALADILREQGLHEALAFLNARTSHRFTAVYLFDGDMLRSVALYDRWDASVQRGDDVPVRDAYCGILQKTGEGLVIVEGRTDGRFPWLADSAVQSYCGVPLLGADGVPLGALCHYDLQRCQTPSGVVPLMQAAAPLVRDWVAQHRK
jgi:GAF domain-containing protein